MFWTRRLSAHYETPVPVAMFDKPRMVKYRRRVLNYKRLRSLPLAAMRVQLGLALFVAGKHVPKR